VIGWLAAAITVLGAVLLAVVKADLEDAAVCRWLARQMVYRAADHLPRGERARWREESIRDLLDLPGRLPPLLWALDTYARSRSWGRERGAPSHWQVLVARVREAWHRLRSLQQQRSIARQKALSKELHPSRLARAQAQVEAEPAHAAAAALDGTAAIGPTILVSEAFDWLSGVRAGTPKQRASSSFLSKEDKEFLARLAGQSEVFLAELAQQRRSFDNRIDRFR
jgi:hypothetical protein